MCCSGFGNNMIFLDRPVRTRCSGKNVFFHNSPQPLPRLHRCKRPSKPSMQCECTVTPINEHPVIIQYFALYKRKLAERNLYKIWKYILFIS